MKAQILSMIFVSTIITAIFGCGSESDSPAIKPEQEKPKVPAEKQRPLQVVLNTCVIENSGKDRFPVAFPYTVKIDITEFQKERPVPFIPLFHKNNLPIWFRGDYAILGPGEKSRYETADSWQWSIHRMQNGHYAFKKLYFRKSEPAFAQEGYQLEFTGAFSPIQFTDRDNQLVIHCNLGG